MRSESSTWARPWRAFAAEIGYKSQSAFSHAFKRSFGRSPRSGRLTTFCRVHGILFVADGR
ncbi:AraC family transcriptional regulator [Mesorhizobium sp. M3A.F.Ca.ET.080.04.2.1]|nr:AraC family transcriptional regulator [Mesorhizobium sp. M3A.F.Ca.ET.080.04.2.1]RWF16981.1 MAG: AraC family transcriptional regulator [Mesorhizobium sp.]